MSAQTTVDQISRFEQLPADLKIPSGDFTGVPQELADTVAQASFEASTVTVVGQHSSGDYSVEFKNQNGGFSSTWPHWAFELAKAALLSQQCSAADALVGVRPHVSVWVRPHVSVSAG
jgi:hypothetical protein